MESQKFGQLPKGQSGHEIMHSPNFRDGKFQKQSFTAILAERETMLKVLKKMLIEKDKRHKPSQKLPSQKTNLLQLNPDENVLVCFGQSSYFMQIDGKKFRADPVFSGAASPIAITTRSFKGTDIYAVDGFPTIYYLMLTRTIGITSITNL